MGVFQTGMEAALQLGGTWTDITGYLYNRTQPAVTITRGRPNETSTVSPSQMTGQLNNRDGRFTSRNPLGAYYPDLTRNTPIRLSVPDQQTYLRIEDDNQSWIACADSTGLQITDRLEVRIDLQLDSYQACCLAAKWGGTAQSWSLNLNDDGTVTLFWWTGSAQASAQSTATLPNLGRIMIRAVLNVSAETVAFDTAPTMSGSQTQLGSTIATGSTTLANGAGESVKIGYAPSGIASQGLTGQVYEVQIYKSTGPTLVADPVFTSQTAGASSFTDAQGNTWGVEGTCELSNRSYRYHGEVSSLPVAWDTSGRDIWVPFQASGILRRLAQGNAPVLPAIRRAVLSLPSPARAYWPMEDGQGATQIASGLASGLPMQFTGTPTLASSSAFACSNPLPVLHSSTFSGAVQHYTSSGSIIVRFLLDASASDSAGTILQIGTTGTYNWYVLYASSSVTVVNDGATIATSAIAVAGVAVMVSVEITPSGGTINLACRVLPAGTDAVVSETHSGSGTIGNVTSIDVNTTTPLLTGSTVGHVYLQDTLTSVATMADPLAAWAGETAGNRFARLCAENSITSRVYGFPNQSVVMGAQSIDTLGNVLQACEIADNGMIYEPRQAFGLGYRTLASMCNQAAALALSYPAAEIGDQENSPVSLTSIDDDQYTRNDVTVTRTSGTQQGSSYEYMLDDGSAMSISPPPAGVGDYANAVSVNVNIDGQLPDAAGWLVHVGTVLQERYPTLTTGLHRPEIIAAGIGYAIQDVNIGDYVQVTSPPAWLPPGTIRLVVAGVTEQLSSYLYQIAWNSIPESPFETGIYDDLVYGRADTDGASLASGVSNSATALSVATANALSPLWTTAAADFPFDINIGDEQITVTGITGTSSPQSFTVTRSVNGVVKSQSADADVRLFYPPVYALT